MILSWFLTIDFWLARIFVWFSRVACAMRCLRAVVDREERRSIYALHPRIPSRRRDEPVCAMIPPYGLAPCGTRVFRAVTTSYIAREMT
jgi:hypothetical protein